MQRKELLNASFFVVLGLVMIYASSYLKAEHYTIGPGFLPTLAGTFLIIVNGLRLTFNLVGSTKEQPNGDTYGFQVMIAMLAMCLYLFSTFLIGIFLSSVVFIAFLMHYLGNRNWVEKVIFCIVVPLAIKAIFKWILVLPLPRGILDLI